VSNRGTYGAAREIYPYANTVACYFTDLPDRGYIIAQLQTYSTDIYNYSAHLDNDAWNGWDAFCDTCHNIMAVYATRIPPPGAEFMEEWKAAQELSAMNDKYVMSSATGLPEAGYAIADMAEEAYDKLKNVAGDATKAAGYGLLIAAGIGLFLLYTWSKAGGKVAVV
jgi:hypothetical protein